MSPLRPPGGTLSLIPPKTAPSFEILFRPSVTLIPIVRCFVEEFYAQVVAEPDAANRLALATHELLDNAAKYSSDGESALFVACDPASGTVSARTLNRATSERIAILERAFAEISAASDAGSLYGDAMRRSAVRVSGSGGLGLARIWAEGEMQLRLSVDGDLVEIRARGLITGR